MGKPGAWTPIWGARSQWKGINVCAKKRASRMAKNRWVVQNLSPEWHAHKLRNEI